MLTLKAKYKRGTQTDVTSDSITEIQSSNKIIYETTKCELVRDVDDDDNDDYEFLEEESKRFGKENVGSLASPYLMPYVYKRRFLVRQYGVRKDGYIFKIGDSPVLVDQDITIKENDFRGSEWLWEFLSRKKVN